MISIGLLETERKLRDAFFSEDIKSEEGWNDIDLEEGRVDGKGSLALFPNVGIHLQRLVSRGKEKA